MFYFLNVSCSGRGRAKSSCHNVDLAMLITVKFCYGNVLYMVRRAILAWLLFVPLLAFVRIQDGFSVILNFDQFSTYDLDDIEGRVIPLFKGFPGWGFHFCSYFWFYTTLCVIEIKLTEIIECRDRHLE